MKDILLYIFVAVAAKAILIGSEFNFYLWWKYGRKYKDWYFNRPQFNNEEQHVSPLL